MILEEMLDSMKVVAKNVFEISKSHAPCYILNINDNIEYMMCEWTCQADKVATVKKIKEMIKTGKLKEFIFIGESWVVVVDKEKDPLKKARDYMEKHDSLSDHPERQEALFMQYSSPFKEETFKADINRKENDITLSDWEDMGKEKAKKDFPLTEGRMQNIFTNAVAENN